MLFFLLIIYLFTPCMAFAYLDPGTGAVLINLLLAGIATLAFFFRGLFFRLIGKKKPESNKKKEDARLVIFSEGKQYWTTFEPIISSFIEKKIAFRYYTLDVHDPALLIENDYMDSRFLGYDSFGKAKVSRINADIMLSTTPNIGTPGYPVQRSPYVKKLIHVLHSLNDISWYKSGSLDHYDEVILGGDYQAVAIRELEKIRKLKEKNLLSLGLPYLDTLLKNRVDKKEITNEKTILIGVSWGSKGLLSYYGAGFIIQLADSGYKVIVRPHPQSFQSEPKLMERIYSEIEKYDNIEWDTGLSPANALARADLLISDTSALRFDFAFVYEKPVITLHIPESYAAGFEKDDLSSSWMDGAAKEIGVVLDENQISELGSQITLLLEKDYAAKIKAFRDETISNFGNAATHIGDYLSNLVNEDSNTND